MLPWERWDTPSKGICGLLSTLSKPKISHLTSVLPSYKADTTVAIFALFLKCWKNLSDIYKITEHQLFEAIQCILSCSD